jgi:hypothetical protein
MRRSARALGCGSRHPRLSATRAPRHCLHDLRVRQVQCDELFALLSAVQLGEVSFRLEQWAVCHLSHAVGCVHMRWRTG